MVVEEEEEEGEGEELPEGLEDKEGGEAAAPKECLGDPLILYVGRREKQIMGDNVSICMRVAGRVFGRFGWDVVKAMQEWMREATITLNCLVGIEERERCEKWMMTERVRLLR